ncbi:NAD(P)/FAD-dependent oxidoreductase [Paenibacillus sp. IHBB 10380]|uniref:NAD(P)/FAD-dependent oxidoreductase n=1 Tax=Paenibacillus sp. IHBB 10380 TaxID=1566358 RepID=UPI0005CF98E1|nr:FAD-dependent oxidoreductase [Paenibacillus sp. IHBB 10380]AJS57634.1 NAD(P)H-nitrite reductase [Paenibacillus sp. IHBB 10380]
MTEKHYVIVGSGVAAVHASKAIRDHDGEAAISIFGEEDVLPYNRIKLSKGLFTDLHSEKVLIKKEKWYRENKIEVQSGTTITKIDPNRKVAMTTCGQSIAYHKLLLCTGASNRKLAMDGATMHNVHNIRDMNDADRLKNGLQNGDHICIIGGGVQGIETAWSFIEAGYQVTIVEAAPRLMIRQLDEQGSKLLTQKIISFGANVQLGQGVKRIVGIDCVQGVELEDDSLLRCEHVVYSIGIVPNTDVACQAGIQVQTGIIVNENMQTSDANVYAAGDAAEFQSKVEGLWGGAIEQGKIAGINMTGNHVAYQRQVPVTLFNAFEMSLFSIGLVDEQQCDTGLTRAGGEPYTRIFIKDGLIAGAISFEGVAASLPYKIAIEQNIKLDGIDLAHNSMEEIMGEIMKRSQK